MVRWIPLAAMGLMALAACSGGAPDPRSDDSPTFGSVLVLADQDLRPMIEDQRRMFEATYEKAQVEVRYLPEAELTRAMLNDSVRAVFGTFRPGGEQEAYFRTRNMTPFTEVVATDAIAVLVHPAGPDSLTLEALRELLSQGTLDGKSRPALFDATGSGVARGLVDSLFGGLAPSALRAAALDGPDAVVARVRDDSAAIGFLGFGLLSDLDDPACRALLAGVKVCRISSGAGTALLPTQGTLKDTRYPLRRPVIMLVTEGKSGLGTGFASFVAGHKGQRIILKQGLAPAHTPAREVMIVTP
ncbi:MAG: substrate-binding domain-containing protein [Flavobacteriales bacterium]|nr:substrate-binding domain-containing protein [Flavobacteriales bacterium]